MENDHVKIIDTSRLYLKDEEEKINNALQDLYAQDADWNTMLHMLSKTEIEKEVELQDLAEGFDSPLFDNVSIQQLKPKVSMTAYEVKEKNWIPSRLSTLFVDDNCDISINEDQNVIVIAEKVSEKAEWTSYKGAMQTNWELHVIYWNSQTGMLYKNLLAYSLFCLPAFQTDYPWRTGYMQGSDKPRH